MWIFVYKEGKMKKDNLIKSICLIIAGNFIFALAVTLFVIPSGLITGGSTGIALTINNYTGLSVTAFVYIFNISMLILGLICLGKKFALTTIVSTFMYPTALGIWEALLDGFVLTDDLLLCAIFAGLGIGIALGLVIRTGSSTGGTDIPTIILSKKFHLSVSVILYAFDVIILISQATFREADSILYGILHVIVYTIVLDKMLLLGTSRTEIKVISSKSAEISDAIRTQMDRGVTLLDGEGGYDHEKKQVLLCVLTNRELPKAEKLIHEIDPESFIIVARVSEVHGRGFSMRKKYLEEHI